MKLTQKYIIGYHIMWYEVQMVEETVLSLRDALSMVENPKNVTVRCTINLQTYLETPEDSTYTTCNEILDMLNNLPCVTLLEFRSNEVSFYNIADARRDINMFGALNGFDVVLWGETDSLWPKQTFLCLESIAAKEPDITKYFATFAYRKNWDTSWDVLVHPLFENVKYHDNEDWALTNVASEKSYMTLQQMHDINKDATMDIWYMTGNSVKFDGSCVAISTELIRAGVNIPLAMFHCGEDTSMMEIAKKIMGDQLVQFHFKDVLRVHNRRHPKKRTGIKNENNPNGFCDIRKGEWWDLLEKSSKYNLSTLHTQQRSIKVEDVIERISKLRSQ